MEFSTLRTRRNEDCMRIVTMLGSWYGKYEVISDTISASMTRKEPDLLQHLRKQQPLVIAASNDDGDDLGNITFAEEPLTLAAGNRARVLIST